MGRSDYTVVVEPDPDPDAVQQLRSNLAAYNVAQMHGDDRYTEVMLTLRDQAGVMRGGVVVGLFWGIAEIDFLWVHDDLRGQGFGRELLAAAERQAFEQGCQYAYLTTYSFQAPQFYQKMGYEIVAEIKDYPPGHTKYTLKKALQVG